MTVVDADAWEEAGGHTIGTTGDSDGTSDDGSQVSVGELPLGDGKIRVLGGALPMPSEGNDHRFGLRDYALTYTGLYILENSIRHDDPGLGVDPPADPPARPPADPAPSSTSSDTPSSETPAASAPSPAAGSSASSSSPRPAIAAACPVKRLRIPVRDPRGRATLRWITVDTGTEPVRLLKGKRLRALRRGGRFVVPVAVGTSRARTIRLVARTSAGRTLRVDPPGARLPAMPSQEWRTRGSIVTSTWR